jgi:hypothetical protein
MVRLEIVIDEETDRLLSDLARDYDGDLSKALTDLVQAHEGLEGFVERSEVATGSTRLRTLRDRAEADFREGRAVPWEDLKARQGL